MSDSIRDEIITALNKGDKHEACSIDREGRVFDALYGEYGTVILSAEQLDNLVELFEGVTDDREHRSDDR